MSSKLIHPDDPAQREISIWRPTGSGTGPGFPNFSGDGNREMDRQTEARLKAAYQQGHAAGEQNAGQAAERRAAQRVEPEIANLKAIASELALARKRFRAEAEEDTVKLAIAIARRVLRRELSIDPDAILGLVKAAFQKLNARETHRLRVSQGDAATMEEHRARLDLPPGLEISGDRSLTPGSAIFETSRGDLDASVDTQLSEIERGFTDIIRRRAQ